MWPVLMLSVALGVAAPAAREAHVLHEEQQMVRLVNAARLQHGLQALAPAPPLTAATRRHAARMASSARIFHSPSLHAAAPGWSALGENVGVASSAEDLFAFFMGSSRHRALILDPAFRAAGAGARIRDGSLYLALMFGVR